VDNLRSRRVMCPIVESTSQEAQELGVKGRRQTQLALMELPKEKQDVGEADSVEEEAVCVVVVAEDVVAQEMVTLPLLLLPLLERDVSVDVNHVFELFYELQ